jgi:hypothetical protein
MMLVRASAEFGPLGSFAMSHQVQFEAYLVDAGDYAPGAPN